MRGKKALYQDKFKACSSSFQCLLWSHGPEEKLTLEVGSTIFLKLSYLVIGAGCS